MKSRKEAPKVAVKRSTGTSSDQDRRPAGPSREEIRLRAYEIYVNRGRADGHDLEPWFLAGRELTERSVSNARIDLV
ncbi:MAG: DUF2934 domain-containing protein [Acidobacteria bacterium]|nr:MAG: DUF2934 domain-containing protein [Acidobacteriota bacterium]